MDDYTKPPQQLELFKPRKGKTGKRLTEFDYRKVATYRDVEWIGDSIPVNATTKTLWRCKKCSHEWLAVYGNVARNGTGCPICSKETQHALRITLEDYVGLEKETGYTWLDRELVSANDKSRWQCNQCEHIWLSSYSNLQQGRRCPECAKKIISDKTRHTIEDYLALALENNVTWLGETVPKSNKEKTLWQCSEGHIYERCYSQMVKSDYGCPQCGIASRVDATRLNRDDYVQSALDRGIRWIGQVVPKNNNEKTFWECSEGHTWEARRHDIVGKGSGCPHCQYRVNGHPTSKQQRQLAEMLNGEMNIFVGRYSVDIALHINNCPIAVEYDSWYWHGSENMQAYDTQRTQAIMQAGWHIVRICSNLLIPSEDELEAAIRFAIENGYAEIILEDWGIGETFKDTR